VLTHFSQRYDSGDAQRLAGEAAMAFGGQPRFPPAAS
jgi:ribonuclease BN (tRNA processing enzyme)